MGIDRNLYLYVLDFGLIKNKKKIIENFSYSLSGLFSP